MCCKSHEFDKVRLMRISVLKRICVAIAILMVPVLSSAQESNLGNWMNYFGSKKINDKWNWHNELQFRNYNAVGDLEQLLIRTGAGYNLTPGNNNLLLGYGYILSENYVDETNEKDKVVEHRIFQQFITLQKFGRASLQHRYRFEQRFIEDDFKMRLRYFLSLNVALNNKELIENTWYLSAYNEIFVNTSSTPFDRNRVYAGLGYKFGPSVRVEGAYMNQVFAKSSRDQINLAVFLSI